LRENHTLPVDHLGNIKAYRFIDVLDFAYTQGFQRFEAPDVTVYPTGGPDRGEPIAVVTACAVFADEEGNDTFHYGIGDASPSNCNKMVGKHFVRMAETRAQGRALSRAMNLNAVLSDELADKDDAITPARGGQAQTFPSSGPAPQRQARATSNGLSKADMAVMPEYWPEPNNEDGTGFTCEITNVPLTGKQAFWSNDKVGRTVCWDEQQKILNATKA
jgi:hypothetical protein